MNNDTLILFMKRLLENGSESKSRLSLKQLQKILEFQNADPEQIMLVKETINNLSETKEASQKDNFSEAYLRIAISKSEARRREAEEERRREAEEERRREERYGYDEGRC